MLDTACPKCQEEGRDTAGDNLRIFDDGGAYCCAGHGFVKDNVVSINKQSRNKMNDNQEHTFKTGIYSDIQSRNISKKTCEFYGYQVDPETRNHIANYYDEAGKVIMQQIRTPDKQFPILGDRDARHSLFGMHLFSPNDSVFVTITEGQIDCLSVADVFDRKYPVVSLPNGAAAAAAVLEKNRQWLEGFKHIVLAFDNDEPGIKATKDCIKLFKPGQVRIAKWGKYKDANEALQANDKAFIRNAVYSAAEYLPPAILTGKSLLDTFDNYESVAKPWPWETANKTINPIFIPGVYSIASWPGIGKTTFVADLMRESIKRGKNITAVSLEQSAPKLTLKLAAAIDSRLDLTSVRNRKLTEEEKESLRPIAEKIVVYDHKTYGSDIYTILENFPYMIKTLNCEYIIFDNLSYAASGLDEDERRGIDKAMLELKDSTEKYNFTLFNICHLNDDSEDFKKCSIRGSRSVQMYSDYTIYLGRDVESQEKFTRDKLEVYIKKDRETGDDTGKSFELHYDHKKRRFL